ncbi:MAG TPA: hypothetical protein DDY77_03570 [Clostridiales bacterium]|nr:hypothetical protein [Clostridiales bacterium]
MKKLLKFLVVCFCALIFVVTPACSSNNNIKEIDSHKAIYRYNVKEIQLLKAGTDTEEILEKTNKYKYYYSTQKDMVYLSSNYSWGYNYKNYFPNASIVSKTDEESRNSYIYSEKYSCKIYMRIVLNGIGKTYYPTYTTDNNLITVSYYETSLGYAFKKEMTTAEKEKIDYKYERDLYEARNDEKKVEKIKENYKKYDFENTAIIKTVKYSVISNTYNLRIDYED